MIYINGIFLTQRVNGINRYSREILRQIDSRKLPFKVTILVPAGSKYEKITENLPIKEIEHRNTIRLTSGEFHYKGWTRKTAERYAYERKAVFVDFSGYCPRKADGVSVIFDLRPLCFDDGVRTVSNFKFKLVFWLNCMITKYRKLDVVTISEYSRKTILETLKIDNSRISNSYCGWQHINSVSVDKTIFERYPELEKGNYYFALGSIAPHKNYQWIHKCAQKNPNAVFAIAGGKELSVFGDSKASEDNKNIIYLGYVSDEQAKALMMYAKAFLFPSKYEGFGIPPLEAMSLGTNVISSDAASLPEVLEDSVYYIEPDDANVDLELLMKKVITPDATERVLQKYSWEKSADVWVDVLTKVVKKCE